MKEFPDFKTITDDYIKNLVGSDLETRKTDQIRRITREFALNPTLNNEVPGGVPVLILPFDDPQLAKLNLFKGKKLLEEGENVTFYTPIPPPLVEFDA